MFGEPAELDAGRQRIAALLRENDLDGALAAFREVFIKTDYSPDCWQVFDEMGSHFADAEARADYDAMRAKLEALAAGPLAP